MNSLKVNTRNTKSKGEIRSLRLAGNIPAIIYGGKEENQKVSDENWQIIRQNG